MSTSGDGIPAQDTAFVNEQKRRAPEGGLNLKPSSRMPAPGLPEPRLGVGAGPAARIEDAVFSCRDVSVLYADKPALSNVSIDIARQQVLAVIGPSGCGASMALRVPARSSTTSCARACAARGSGMK